MTLSPFYDMVSMLRLWGLILHTREESLFYDDFSALIVGTNRGQSLHKSKEIHVSIWF